MTGMGLKILGLGVSSLFGGTGGSMPHYIPLTSTEILVSERLHYS